jgi:hypothetical protein
VINRFVLFETICQQSQSITSLTLVNHLSGSVFAPLFLIEALGGGWDNSSQLPRLQPREVAG